MADPLPCAANAANQGTFDRDRFACVQQDFSPSKSDTPQTPEPPMLTTAPNLTPCRSQSTPEWRARKREQAKKYGRKNRVLLNEKLKAWARRNPEKHAAHAKVQYAIKWGHLIKPKSCTRCPETHRLHAHHHDYSRPLDVTWLCPLCHKSEHRRLRDKAEALNMSRDRYGEAVVAALEIEVYDEPIETLLMSPRPAAVSDDPLDRIVKDESYGRWMQAIQWLDVRESVVLWGRVRGETLEQLGHDLRVTRQRIQQIEARAIRELRAIATVMGLNVPPEPQDPLAMISPERQPQRAVA